SGEDVMDAGPAVGRRRTFEEHERRRVLSKVLHLEKQALALPGLEELALEPVRAALGPGWEGRHANRQPERRNGTSEPTDAVGRTSVAELASSSASSRSSKRR